MADKKHLLVVDDERNTRDALVRYLRGRFQVTAAADGAEAIELLMHHDYDLVLTDLRMPGADGMSVLEAVRGKASHPACVLLTAYGSIGDAVKAVKNGAFDFVPKPIKLDKLEEVIDAALADGRGSGAEAPEQSRDAETSPGVIMPDSPDDPMHAVLDKARTVAPTRTTVLLTGESGTGKEVVARFIHDNSRRGGLFVPVHCAALTATLLESELFGYEKGAFTGAAERRRGRFELADHGTLFLDEIGEIDAPTQVKLLRVLETRSFERVGGTETIKSDVRLIAATNRDLKRMVADGEFREDLYYRLSVINLELPPLRDRRMAVSALAKNFAAEFAAENAREISGFSPAAMAALERYRWPGNIRELRNCVESMVVLATGSEIAVSDIPPEILHDTSTPTAPRDQESTPAAGEAALSLAASERELIAAALARCNGNRTAAAKELGISRRTLHRRLAEAEGKLG